MLTSLLLQFCVAALAWPSEAQMKRKLESTIPTKPRKSLRALTLWTSLLLIGAGTLFLAGKAQPKSEATEVVERAIYKVRADQIANYPAARAQMLAALKTFSGYRSGQTFRAVSDSTLYRPRVPGPFLLSRA